MKTFQSVLTACLVALGMSNATALVECPAVPDPRDPTKTISAWTCPDGQECGPVVVFEICVEVNGYMCKGRYNKAPVEIAAGTCIDPKG
jgi:hypothetical protein